MFYDYVTGLHQRPSKYDDLRGSLIEYSLIVCLNYVCVTEHLLGEPDSILRKAIQVGQAIKEKKQAKELAISEIPGMDISLIECWLKSILRTYS